MKKGLNIVDLIGQTFIILLVVVDSIRSLDYGLEMMVKLMAPWQVISCIVMIVMSAPFKKYRIMHLVVSIVVVILLSGVFLTGLGVSKLVEPGSADITFGLMYTGFAIAFLLGMFYYYISFKTVRAQRSNAGSLN